MFLLWHHSEEPFSVPGGTFCVQASVTKIKKEKRANYELNAGHESAQFNQTAEPLRGGLNTGLDLLPRGFGLQCSAADATNLHSGRPGSDPRRWGLVLDSTGQDEPASMTDATSWTS